MVLQKCTSNGTLDWFIKMVQKMVQENGTTKSYNKMADAQSGAIKVLNKIVQQNSSMEWYNKMVHKSVE